MYHADVAQLVERDLAKVEVAGSSPVVRSKVTMREFSRVAAYVPLEALSRARDAEESVDVEGNHSTRRRDLAIDVTGIDRGRGSQCRRRPIRPGCHFRPCRGV